MVAAVFQHLIEHLSCPKQLRLDSTERESKFFGNLIENYKAGLAIEKAAVEAKK